MGHRHGYVGILFNRQDLNLTSKGRGHYYTKGYYFPPSRFRRTLPDELPPSLLAPDRVTANDAIAKHYLTTTGAAHDFKYMGGKYAHPSYKIAPGSWKVYYIKDNKEKLKLREWTDPLTIGNQKSEVQANYDGKTGLSLDKKYQAGPQPFNLSQHHKEGPSQRVIGSTQNKVMSGKPFFIRDNGALKLNDIYMSETQKAHRSFTREELLGYPKKDFPTIWNCEEYTKAWGHGTNENPLPKDSVPRDIHPIRDLIWFPTATKIPRLPKAMVPVPHMGLESLVQDSYQTPSYVNMKEVFLCPIDTPWVIPRCGPKEVMTIPKMYKTEYMTYGGRRLVIMT